MNFGALQSACLRLSPNQLTIDPADPSNVGAIVNDAYSTLLRYRHWVACRKVIVTGTRAPYFTGSITCVMGSPVVHGVGTQWTTAVVPGEFLTIPPGALYRISAVNSDTQITLEQPWFNPSVSGGAYQIISNRITLPPDAEEVETLRGQFWMLVRETSTLIDIADSLRTVLGVPLVFNEVTTYDGNNGAIEVELWPVPAETRDYQLVYTATIPPLVNLTDVPVLSADVIMKSAQAETCGILASRTGEQMWLTLGRAYRQEFEELRDSLARQDARRQGIHPTVLDAEDLPNFNDPGWLSAYRALQATAMVRIA